tara:strand:+ start:182 stop:757 length:576 start_codon:yes stop_codon:yes gene_type:complete
MKRLDNYLKETTLSRVFRHFRNEKIPVGIITAFRGDNTYKENVKRNKVLAAKIKANNYGYFYVEGHWQEQDDEVLIDVKEDSIVIIGSENDNGKLKGLLKIWVKDYNQDAALFKDEGTAKIVLIDKSGKSTEISNKFSLKKLEIGYTKLHGRGGRSFSFDEERDGLGWLGRMKEKLKNKEYNIDSKYLGRS